MSADDSKVGISELLETITDPAAEGELDTVVGSLADRLLVREQEETTVETEGIEEEFEFTDLVVNEEEFEQVLTDLQSKLRGAPIHVRRQSVYVAGGLIDALLTQSSTAVSYDGELAVNELVPVLATGLSDPDETVRQAAADLLSLVARTRESPLDARITSQTPVHLVVDDLQRALDSEDVTAIRETMVETLHRLSVERPAAVEPAIPDLCDAADSPTDDIRNPAVATLANLFRSERLDYRSPRPPYTLVPSAADADVNRALAALAASLGHVDAGTRQRAATGIANAAYHVPAVVDPVVPELCRALKTADGDIAETLTSAIAYLSRGHPLLAVPALTVLVTRDSSGYARGARQLVADSYPSAVDNSEHSSAESEDLPSDIAMELLVHHEQNGGDVRRLLESTRHDGAERSNADLIDALCTPLLEFEDPRAVVFACEALARSVVTGGEITERACEALSDLAGGPHRIETAPRVTLQIVQQHHPSVVDSVSSMGDTSLTVFDSNEQM